MTEPDSDSLRGRTNFTESEVKEIFDGPDYVALRPEGETAPESG